MLVHVGLGDMGAVFCTTVVLGTRLGQPWLWALAVVFSGAGTVVGWPQYGQARWFNFCSWQFGHTVVEGAVAL